MDAEKLLGRMALLIPSAHITICTLYLSCLSIGFGSRLFTMFSATDYFTITIHRLVAIYVYGLIMPALLFWVLEIFFGRNFYDPAKSFKSQRRFIFAAMLFNNLPVIFGLPYLLYYKMQGFYVPAIAWAGMFAIFIFPFIRIANVIFRVPEFARGIVLFSVTLVLMAGAIGYDDGVAYRRSELSDVRRDGMTCDDRTIILAVGDNFLAVSKSGKRQIVGEDCKVKFTFTQAPPLKWPPLTERLFSF